MTILFINKPGEMLEKLTSITVLCCQN